TPELEYRMLFGITYSPGNRKGEIQGWLKSLGNPDGGACAVLNNQLLSRIITHTLTYNKKISKDLNLTALAGYEYWKTTFQGAGTLGSKFDLNQSQATINPDYHYYDNLQGRSEGNLGRFNFKDPSVEIQSYFARDMFNYWDK